MIWDLALLETFTSFWLLAMPCLHILDSVVDREDLQMPGRTLRSSSSSKRTILWHFCWPCAVFNFVPLFQTLSLILTFRNKKRLRTLQFLCFPSGETEHLFGIITSLPNSFSFDQSANKLFGYYCSVLVAALDLESNKWTNQRKFFCFFLPFVSVFLPKAPQGERLRWPIQNNFALPLS